MLNTCIYDIAIETFLETVKENVDGYAHICRFYLPIIEKRAEKHSESAEDCLLNPIFRWCYLNTRERLAAFEQELSALKKTLGSSVFDNYQKSIMADIVNHTIENQAHDRMLAARAEIRGMLYYGGKGCSISLEHKQQNKRKHDFNAYCGNSNIAVEAKFIHLFDKVGTYLMRWWQAQTEISNTRPLGYIPYIRFRWHYNGNRNELNEQEIYKMKSFFRTVFDDPNSDKELSLKRIRITYSPNNTLPISTVSLEAIEESANYPVALLMKKIKRDVDDAQKQLCGARQGGMRTACYLLLNVDGGVQVRWEDKINSDIEALKNEYKNKGLDIIIENVYYM